MTDALAQTSSVESGEVEARTDIAQASRREETGFDFKETEEWMKTAVAEEEKREEER